MTADVLMAAVIGPIAQFLCFLAIPLLGLAIVRRIGRT